MKNTRNIPQHVALIPDGNRRWAKKQGLKAFDGHNKGVEAFEAIAERAADRGVKYISLWGMSLDNFSKRSKPEVAGLMKIFEAEFGRLAKSKKIHDRQTKIRVLGRWNELFQKSVLKSIEGALRATQNYDQFNLTFLLAYNGTDDMMQAIQSLVDGSGENESMAVTDEFLKGRLMTAELPPVDLLVRTAGDPHLSNGFMMWDTANAELIFTKTLWPEFSPDEFDQALEEFAVRRRRLGT